MQIRILPNEKNSTLINILVNGRRRDIPVGQIVTVSDEELRILRDAGVTYTYGDALILPGNSPLQDIDARYSALLAYFNDLSGRVVGVEKAVVAGGVGGGAASAVVTARLTDHDAKLAALSASLASVISRVLALEIITDNVPLPAVEYDQGMGATDATGLVIAFPLRTTGTAQQFWGNTAIGNDAYNGKSPYPGFRLNGTGTNFQYGATGPGVADAAYGPKATYVEAVKIGNQNQGNQYFFAEGQTFLVATNAMNARWCGNSVDFPVCFQSYDPSDPLNTAKHGRAGTAGQGDRPILQASGGIMPGVLRGDAVSYSNWAFRGLHFYSAGNSVGMTSIAKQDNFLIENCIYENVQPILDNGNPNVGFDINFNNIMRRSVSFGQATLQNPPPHVCGIHSSHTYLTIEDCIFWHNGWKVGTSRDDYKGVGGPDIFKHAMYLVSGEDGVPTRQLLRRNVIMDASAGGFSMRGNHVKHHNVVIDCPTPDQNGAGVSWDGDNPDGVYQYGWCQLVMGGADINSATQRSGGFSSSGGKIESFYRDSLYINNPSKGIGNNKWLQASSSHPDVLTFVGFRGNRAYNFADASDRVVIGSEGQGNKAHVTITEDVDNVLSETSPVTNEEIYAAIGYASKDAMVAAMIADPMQDWAYKLLRVASQAFNHDFNRMYNVV